MADHMGIGQDCLSGARLRLTSLRLVGRMRYRRPAGCRIVVELFRAAATFVQQAGAVGFDWQPVMPFARVVRLTMISNLPASSVLSILLCRKPVVRRRRG